MATLIQAVGRYGPRTVQGPHAEIDELCAWMARSSGLNPNNAKQAFAELGDALVFYCLLYTSPSPRDRTRSRMPSSA